MSNLAKLAKQAVQLEHDRHYERALALFARLFDEAASAEEEVDVALFNRAGDVAVRLGDAAGAVRYYERAVDAYAAGGLLNNAIAVCNKMVRQAPDHAATYYTLGVLHAKQGFRGDAKHHFVEYADRMHRAGRDDEALRALGDFAALCPAGDDVRTALAQHLAKGHRSTEVAARLQAMLDGAPALRPAVAPAPAAGGAPAAAMPASVELHGGALVFLDVSSDGADVPVAPLVGLEPTAHVDAHVEPTVDVGPMPDDSVIALDAPLDLDVESWQPVSEIVDLELSGDHAIELPVALSAAEPVDAPSFDVVDLEPVAAASAPRYGASLPGELPMLSLAGWIGSASAVGVIEPVVADEPTCSVLLPLLESDDTVFAPAPLPAAGEASFVDLGAWLRESEPSPSTRMTTEATEPTGDETADFDQMLGTFRAGVARNVDADDYASHYDLGVAFREMGLVDDAIAAFQKAARAPAGGLRAREALGQCFIDRGSPELAVATLQRAIEEHEAVAPGAADDAPALGVVYLLGVCHAQLGAAAAARACFERVVASDIQFRDAAARLSQLSDSSP